ncbi:MAG: AbrB/MazE/SpoVT family DNA-binding domain-containing protein [Devosia sp.]
MSNLDRIEQRSSVSSRGQTTIPKEFRDQLGIVEGTELTWVLKDGQLSVEAKTRRLADYAGILGNPLGRAVSVDEMNAAILDQAVALHERSKA